MNHIKNIIKYRVNRFPALFNIYRYMYTVLIHRDRLMKTVKYGEQNEDNTILVIRPSSEDGIQGLMSLFVQAMRWIDYSERYKYLPYVDFKNYKTQYYDGTNNAWEFFFSQPSQLSNNEVYASKRVILSGVSLKITVDDNLFRHDVFSNESILSKCHNLIRGSINLSDEVAKSVNNEANTLNIKDCIGVYIRGTDYVKLKPVGEYRQPDINEVTKKVREFLQKYPSKRVFLVTEDAEYYDVLKKEFPELLCTVSFDSFISGYDGKNYLSKTGLLEDDKKKRGMDYLVKIILLSKCRYLISSITMGSIAAYCFNGGKYEDEYIFDLGFYE